MTIELVLDTDIGSDIDDALALAYALRHPDIELRAVSTVADDTRWRGWIAKKLLKIAGSPDIEVAAGVGWKISPSGRPSAWPHDGHGLLESGEAYELSERDAATVLIESTGAVIATIGMPSNVAAAVDRDPTFASRVPLYAVMGGCFAPIVRGGTQLPPSLDHNLCVDPQGSLGALGAGMPMLFTPIDVTVHAELQPRHLESLRGGDEFCRVLASAIDAWLPTSHLPAGITALLHDPLTMCVLVDRRFVTSMEAKVTAAIHPAGHVRTFIDPLEGTPSEIVTSVDGPAFADHWLDVVLG